MFITKKTSIYDSQRKGLSSQRKGLLKYDNPLNTQGGLTDIKKLKIDFLDDDFEKPIFSKNTKDNSFTASINEFVNLSTGQGDVQALNLVPNEKNNNEEDDELVITPRENEQSDATIASEMQNEQSGRTWTSENEQSENEQSENEQSENEKSENNAEKWKLEDQIEDYESVKNSIITRLKKDKFDTRTINAVIKHIEDEINAKTYEDYKKLTYNFKEKVKHNLTNVIKNKLTKNEDNINKTNKKIDKADMTDLSKLTRDKDMYNDEKRLLEEKLEKINEL